MKEESKYYTPEPEEFHMGFEYEISTREGTWLKDAYMCNSKVGVTFDDMPELAKISRVKLLDRSDIEDLGWEYQKSDDFGYDYFTLKKNAFKDYYILFSGRTKRMVIGESGENTFTGEGTPLFTGWPKNKGELQDVLKMIGI